MKKILHLFLLFAIGFSIAHGVLLDIHQNEHCSANEYVAEFSKPLNHELEKHDGDICNSHFMFHLTFLVPSNFTLLELENLSSIIHTSPNIHLYHYIKNSFRPPIV